MCMSLVQICRSHNTASTINTLYSLHLPYPAKRRSGVEWFKRKTTHKEVPQLESRAKVQQFKKGFDTTAKILHVYVQANSSYREEKPRQMLLLFVKILDEKWHCYVLMYFR